MINSINLRCIDNYVEACLKYDKSGHDYPHIMRVHNNIEDISPSYYPEADMEVLWAAGYLHDIAFKDGWVKNHHLVGARQAETILPRFGASDNQIRKIKMIIEDHVGMIGKPIRDNSELCIESKILRDADNLDALGSIGIIRQIAFGTANNIPYFISKEDGWDESIYGSMKEIITWADKMLTPRGKHLAEQRVPVMKEFIEQLEREYAA
jgi:uncharacterized protein